VLLVAVGLLMTAPADARWSKPVDASHAVVHAEPVLKINARGDRALVWEVPDGGVRVAVAAAGRRFGKPHAVPGSADGYSPRVAISPRGDVLVAWNYADRFRAPAPGDFRDEGCCQGMRAAVLTARGRFGKTVTLAPRGMETGLDGMAIASPSRFTLLFGAAREEGGAGGTFERVARGTARIGARRRIAARFGYQPADTSFVGSTTRVVYRADSRRGVTLAERIRSASGHWGRQRVLYRGKEVAAFLQIVTVRSGGQVGTTDGIHMLTRRADERFRVQRLSGYGTLAVAPNGAAALVSARSDGTARVATRQAGHRFGPYQVISEQRKGTPQPHGIAVDPAGRAYVLFDEATGSGSTNVVTTSRTGRRTGIETIVAGHRSIAGFAMDGHGRGTVIYNGHSSLHLFAAYGS
jgi:hypothetical protein